jgi:chromosome segregation ATPase
MATMDEKCAATTPDAEGGPAAKNVRHQRRQRAQEILSAQRLQLDRIENELPGELQRLVEEIARDLASAQAEHLAKSAGDDASGARAELQPQLDELRVRLAASQEELDRSATQIEQARLEAGRFEHELHVCQSLLREAQTQHEQGRVEFATLGEQLADAQAQLTAARTRQDELRSELADQREQLAAREDETKTQRRRVARNFKALHARRLAEIDKRKTRLEALAATGQSQSAAQLDAAQSELSQAQRRLHELGEALQRRGDELAQARHEATSSQDEAAELRHAVATLRRACENREASPAASEGGDQQDELDKLRGERDILVEKLAAAEINASADASLNGDGHSKDELRRRLEMAVEDLREVKRANAELEAKLASGRGESPSSAVGKATGLDWEAQKRRLLASWEADDDDGEAAVAERITIEGTIQITDQIVSQKDQEIFELKRLIGVKSEIAVLPAHNAAAAEILDRDELVRQELERLRLVQAEWREKIGGAELDISMERAKLARDKSELEEKMRLYQREQQSRADDEGPPDAGKRPRGRWLARLGLKDLDEKP